MDKYPRTFKITYHVKNLFEKIGVAFVALISIIVLGLLVPMLVSTFVVLTTRTTLEECVISVPFWIFTILGWLIACIYVNDAIINE